MTRCPACNHRLYVAEDLVTGIRGEVCHHCGWPSSVNAD